MTASYSTTVQTRVNPLVHLALLLGTGAVFWADLYWAGVVVWVLYLIPLAATLYLGRPSSPLYLATGISALLLTGMVLAPDASVHTSRIDRTLALATVWGMALVIRQVIVNRAEVRRRDWIKVGQAGLATAAQGEKDPRELADAMLAFLCDYVSAPVGALYVRGSENSLRLTGRYALDASNEARDVVGWGEGLVGQAAKDRRTLVVDEVPGDHLTVSSGLRRVRPGQVVVVPAIADRRLVAVLELGFTQPMDPAVHELLESASEPVAVAVRSAQYQERLEELLARTQQQAEELQAQQEELRVSNEELEEQSRALRESQTRLENQQAELEQTNTQLEEQAQALELQRDELARAKVELTRKADELERANQYKSEFLANMSHELRTPLNSSLILAKLLADNKGGNLSEEQVRFAHTIHAANSDLLLLINDILDLARIESGRMQLQPEKIRLETAVRALARTVEPLAEDKGLGFEVDLDPALPQSILTDGQRLEQILKNLLSNAVKFTERGRVTLRVHPMEDERIAFAVEDSGIGISAEQQEVIFEAFRQADGSTHRKFGGTGLGLSISRDLARRLGGDIEVESDAGRGSTFTLVLPRRLPRELREANRSAPIPLPKRPPAPPPAPAPTHTARGADEGPRSGEAEETPAAIATAVSQAPAVRAPRMDDDRDRLAEGGRTLLVIEDDPRFARIVQHLAHEKGFQCLLAPDADEGIELAKAYRPSAVILDMNLPDQSGLSVLQQLKHEGATRHIPVHVVSVADYTQQALEMGAVGYDLKPVKREEMEDALQGLLGKAEQQLRHVLVVEDDAAQRESLFALLASDEVELTVAATAAEALDHLERTSFDCMVLDLGLPDLSGYELLERMSEDDVFAFPPVIVYTGRELPPDEEARLRQYSRSIVIKGARSPERLLDEVTLFLHRVESDLPREQQRILQEVRSRESAFEGRRILLAEDDVRNVFALTSILEPKGARIEVARNGRKALELLDRVAAEGNGAIDLVLMDVMMPEMDGLTATREIRKRPAWEKVPIIALTAKAMADDREKCLEAGANDYIAKPLDVDKLLSLMRVWMPR